ncbi:hypothetical protein ACFSTI_02745 [Rhizorhabdus histidinilytica]
MGRRRFGLRLAAGLGLELRQRARGTLVAVDLEAAAIEGDRRLDIAAAPGEVPAAQGEIGVVGVQRMRGPIGLVGPRRIAALAQHVAKLHPDREIIGAIAEVTAILRSRSRPSPAVALDARPHKCAPGRAPP